MRDLNDNLDQQTDAGSNFSEYLGRLLKMWPLFILSIIVCFVGAWLYLRYKAVPLYNVDAKILIEDNKQSPGGGGQAGFIDLNSIFGTKNSVDNEVEILQTRYLMECLVRDLKLNIIWYAKGAVKNDELFEVPFELVSNNDPKELKMASFEVFNIRDSIFQLSYNDAATGETVEKTLTFNKAFHIPTYGSYALLRKDSMAIKNDRYIVKVNTIENQAASFMGSISAELSSKLTTIIALKLTHTLPAKGEFVLKSLIDEYIKQNIRDKSRIADSTIAFIDNRILLVSSELDGIEQKIQHFMQGKGLANISAQSQLLLQNNSEYLKEVAGVEAQIEVMNEVEHILSNPNTKTLVSGSVLGSTNQMDQGFNSLLTSYNGLVLERERLRVAYTPDHPYVKNADVRIESARQNILSYLSNTRNSLKTKIEQVSKSSGKLEGSIRQVPAQERAFLDLSRQQQLKQSLYLFLLQKREETAVGNTSNLAGIRVIDPPRAEKTPISPNTKVIWLGSLIFALLIPISKIYLDDLLNNKVRDRRDIEKKVKAPVLSEISHNDTSEKYLISFDSSRSPLAEQFRGLRTNLQFLMPKDTDKVVLVTSGMPGEGKSFTSLNLANVFAVSGRRVLLLEFDLRKPQLSKTYENKRQYGLTNFLIDENLQLEDIVTEVDKNLFFAASGPIPPNPAELILSKRTTKLFEQAKNEFDIVVIDAPPIGAVTDGQLLGKHADATLYMVRANYTPHNLLTLPSDLIREKKLTNLAIVLNDVKAGSNSYYGYTYGYYNKEEQKESRWKRKSKN